MLEDSKMSSSKDLQKTDPPARKVKPLVTLKDVHTEQTSKLSAKHQQEADLLDDVRSFSKQRAIIEKEYGQALSKLSQLFQRKDLGSNLPSTTTNAEGKECRQVGYVWKSLLEKTDRIGQSHVLASDVFQQQISDNAKSLLANKIQTHKKAQDKLFVIQSEVGQSIRDLSKAQSTYNEEEHRSHETRVKAREYDERIKKKITGVFQSMGTLKRNSAKFSSKRASSEVRSTSARNDYLINAASSNAHQQRYSDEDLPVLMQILDGESYEKMSEYMALYGKTEVSVAMATVDAYSTIQNQAKMISREYSRQCYLEDNPVFRTTLQYEFEPIDNDPINVILMENTDTEKLLEKEGKRWATKIAKETKALRIYKKLVVKLQNQIISTDKKSSNSGSDKSDKKGLDPETKLELLNDYIRKAETTRLKVEAKLSILREGGVKVDEFLNNAMLLALDDRDDISRTVSQMSFKTNMSDEEEDDSQDNAHFDETFDETINVTIPASVTYPRSCYAIYDFQSSNADELSFKQGDQLQVQGPGDGDGWLQAHLSDGTEGYIPQNYVHLYDNDGAHSHNNEQTTADTPTNSEPPINKSVKSNGSVTPVVTQTAKINNVHTTNNKPSDTTLTGTEVWARALYDYTANNAEEVSFVEGQIIRILRKDENGVDDGWWEGEIDGKVGVFPCLVVEELIAQQSHTCNQNEITKECDTNGLPAPPDLPVEPVIPTIITECVDDLPPPPPPPPPPTATAETPAIEQIKQEGHIDYPKPKPHQPGSEIIFKPAIRPTSIKPIQTVQPVPVLAKDQRRSPVMTKVSKPSVNLHPVIIVGPSDKKSPGATTPRSPILIAGGPFDKHNSKIQQTSSKVIVLSERNKVENHATNVGLNAVKGQMKFKRRTSVTSTTSNQTQV